MSYEKKVSNSGQLILTLLNAALIASVTADTQQNLGKGRLIKLGDATGLDDNGMEECFNKQTHLTFTEDKIAACVKDHAIYTEHLEVKAETARTPVYAKQEEVKMKIPDFNLNLNNFGRTPPGRYMDGIFTTETKPNFKPRTKQQQKDQEPTQTPASNTFGHGGR